MSQRVSQPANTRLNNRTGGPDQFRQQTEENIMKRRTFALIIALAVMAALVVPLHMAAQDNQDHQQRHHHYKLIDLGTFGGPQSYVNFPDLGYGQVLNNSGGLAGWADTSKADPYPDFCFNEDCFVSRAFQWQNGTRIPLGGLADGLSSSTAWISPNGLIAGESENGQLDPLFPGFPVSHAVLWENGVVTDLGTMEGGYESVASAVNSHGQVAGAADNNVLDANALIMDNFGWTTQTRAYLWQNGVMQDLGTLGGTDAAALFVNENGQVAGVSYTNSNASEYCANNLGFPLTTGTFIWENGEIENVGSFGGTCTFAQDLNNRGQVVGASTLTGDEAQHPFLWDQGKLIDLKTFGGSVGTAIAINDEGLIAGWASERGDQANHTFLWSNGKKIDLGTIEGDLCSYPSGINSSGQIVGASAGTCPYTSTRAFLWENGGPMVDLNALIPSDSALYLTSAYVINDRGEIVSQAVLPDGNQHIALLIRCDQNHPSIDGCDYSLVDAIAATQNPAPRPAPSGTQRLPQQRRSGRYYISGMARATIGTASEGTDPRPLGQHQRQ
jgi:probable HAF family extracellular repeat protein